MKILSQEEFYAAREAEAINESILGSLVAGVTGFVKGAMKGLLSPFTSIIKDMKLTWKNGVTANKVRDTLLNAVKDTFGAIVKQIDEAKTAGEMIELLTKAGEMNLDMSKTYQKALEGMKESWALNEDAEPAQGDDEKIDSGAATSIVNKIMQVSGNAIKQMIKQAQEDTKKNMELEKFRETVKNAVLTWTKNAEKAINGLDVAALVKLKDTKDASGLSNDKLAKRQAAKYEPEQKVVYIKDDGTKATGTVSKDLGDSVEFKAEDGSTFKKDKKNVLGKNDKTEPAAAVDWKTVKPEDAKSLLKKGADSIPDDKMQKILAILKEA